MRTAVLALTVVLVGLGALLLIRRGTSHEVVITGSLLAVTGFALMGLARRQLGGAFSMAPRARGLVTQGLYAKIPHPMYVFLDLCLLGVAIATRREWLLVILAALVVAQAWQSRREAKVLEQAFGDAYREYRKRTWW